MINVTVGRYENDATAQGVIQPEDKRWQLVIDKDGYPHLYVAAKYDVGDGTQGTGMVCVEDFLVEGFESVRDLMDGEFGGVLTPEEEAEAAKEWRDRKERTGIPCPR